MKSARSNISIPARILRVNHGGETGAIQIYRIQSFMAGWVAPDLRPFLSEALEHERRHQAVFRSLMPQRNAKPCRLMWVWGVGGAVLGFSSGLLGREGVLACTQAVERTVHEHLDAQIAWAQAHDPILAREIAKIQTEEFAHLSFADGERRETGLGWYQRLIAAATEALIWLSTRGDSSRLARLLAADDGGERGVSRQSSPSTSGRTK